MNSHSSKSIFYVFFLIITVLSCKKEAIVLVDNVKFVDPQIGGVAPFLQPTRTRIHLPNSMVRMYPERDDYRDDQITSFPLTTRKHRSDLLFNIMPVSGDLPKNEAPISAWDQELEIAHPYYYSTWLEDYDITVEFTPAAQAGYFRFNYQNDKSRKLYLKNLSGENWTLHIDGSLTGSEVFEGMEAFVYAKIDSLTDATKVLIQRDSLNSWISWNDNKSKKINFKYGLSFISVDQAKKNLHREIPDFDFEGLKSRAHQAWSKVMNQIEVEGGTDAYKRTFYTALYRSYERMINITEDGKYYSNYDQKIHEDEQDFYADDWVWDTYLALHPLRFILHPEMQSNMMASSYACSVS